MSASKEVSQTQVMQVLELSPRQENSSEWKSQGGIMHLDLSSEEQSLLITILRERQREFLHEIARTDSREFRRGLQDREVILEALLRRLTPDTASNTAA